MPSTKLDSAQPALGKTSSHTNTKNQPVYPTESWTTENLDTQIAQGFWLVRAMQRCAHVTALQRAWCALWWQTEISPTRVTSVKVSPQQEKPSIQLFCLVLDSKIEKLLPLQILHLSLNWPSESLPAFFSFLFCFLIAVFSSCFQL